MTIDRQVAPRIEQLRANIAAVTDGSVAPHDPTDAATAPMTQAAAVLERFWSEAERTGTPLIEPADDPKLRWVTFLWRVGVDDRDVPDPRLPVMVMGGPALWWEMDRNVLDVLPGTDVAFRSYRVPVGHRGRYIMSPGDPLTPLPRAGTPESVTRAERFRRDPRNPETLVLTADPEDPLTSTAIFSTFALPGATERSWAEPRDGVDAGEVVQHRLESRILGNSRRVWTYRPPATGSAGRADPLLLVVLDGRDWIDWTPLVTTVDNLIADGLLPPVSMVLPEALDTATRYRELTALPAFTDFLAHELMPFTREHLPVPADPRRIAVHGKSFGALGALAAGLARPDVFGTVLSQSGSFWWSGWERDRPELLIEQVRRHTLRGRPARLRVSLDIGVLEGEAMVGSHERMAQALGAAGFPLRTHRYHGGHDINCWVSELPAALRWWADPLSIRT